MQQQSQKQIHWAMPFFTIWTGQAISQLGSRAAGFAVVWWLTQTTGSATVLTLSTMMFFLAQVFLGPAAGALIDRWNRRVVMIVADIVVALTTAWLATLFWQESIQVWHVLLANFLSAVGGMVQFTSMTASTSLMVPEKHLGRVQGANQALSGLLSIGGPALGALFLAFIPLHQILGVDVATAVFAILPLLWIAIPQPKATTASETEQDERTSIWAEMKIGAQYIWAWPGLRLIVFFAAIFNFIFNPTLSLLPLLITDHFHGQATHLAGLEAAFGIGIIIGGTVLGVWGGFQRRIWTILLGALGSSSAFLVVGMAPATAFWLAWGGMFLMGSMNALINGPFFALLQARIAPELQGRVFSIVMSAVQIITVFGFLIVGPLTDQIGVRTWFIVGGVAAILLSIGISFVPAIINLEANQDDTITPEPDVPLAQTTS